MATVTQDVTARTETTITIKWTVSGGSATAVKRSTNGGTNYASVSGSGRSGSYTVSGLQPGTTYDMRTKCTVSGSDVQSATLDVRTYDYPYAYGLQAFMIGETIPIRIYNPLGRSVTFALIAANGQSAYTSAAMTSTGVSLNTSNSAIKPALYASIPSAASGSYRVDVTYGSHTSQSGTNAYTVNAGECSPTIGAVSYADVCFDTLPVTGDAQKIVQGLSEVSYTAQSVAARCSATIASVRVEVNGKTVNLSASQSVSGKWTGGGASWLYTIDADHDINAVVIVTDSRGVTTEKTLPIAMIGYQKPSAEIAMQRQNGYYTQTDLTVAASVTAVGSNAIVTLQYRLAEATDAPSYGSYTALTGGQQTTFSADNTKDWLVQINIVDSFGISTTYTVPLARGTPIIYFDRIKSSVGVNCFPLNNRSLEALSAAGKQLNLTYDSGWQDVTLSNGVRSSDSFAKCRRVGNVVTIAMMNVVGWQLGAANPFATLPAGCRPALPANKGISFVVPTGAEGVSGATNKNYARVAVYPEGGMAVTATTGDVGKWIDVFITFVAD